MRIHIGPLGKQLSRFELFMVVSLVLLMAWIALERAEGLVVQMEKVRLSTSVAQLRTAVQLQAATQVINGGLKALAAMEGANPMRFGEADLAPGVASSVVSTADNVVAHSQRYLGELHNPDPGDIAGGKWYYDSRAGVLVYRVENEAHFMTPLIGPKRARFRVMAEYDDLNGNGCYDAGTERLTWARLTRLEHYTWRE